MTAPKTNAQRQADHKARMEAAGYKLFKRWVHLKDVPHVESYAKWLEERRQAK